ncbi:DUF2553 family protein [Anaerobacillus sp. MEB173]|uniref:DUF2553 family protein n=1 Tax=Anaerobacillus sp. MEB173 TaxID=3383345 RepID=UPI003F92F7E2
MEKLDVTDRIQGKLCNGNIVLYYNEDEIGEINLSSGLAKYELSEEFQLENNKIYLNQDVEKINNQDTEDCDLGWC